MSRSVRYHVTLTPTKKARIYDAMRHQSHTAKSLASELGISERAVYRFQEELRSRNAPPDFYKARAPGQGRRPRIEADSDGLREAERRIDAGEAHDGGDIGRALFPDVPARTVRKTLAGIGLVPGLALKVMSDTRSPP
jgi:hypothetical protein